MSSSAATTPTTPRVTAEQLRTLCPEATLDLEAIASAANDYFGDAEMTTALRIAHFFGQAAVETDLLRFLEEQGTDSYFLRYEPGTTKGDALGNTEVGDGARYKGRGLIHLTGRWNYGFIGKRLQLTLEDTPTLVATVRVAVQSSGDYWKWKGCNASADADSVSAVTKKVQGGQDQLERRRDYTRRAKIIWGVTNDLLGSVGTKGDNEPTDVRKVQQRLVAKGYLTGPPTGELDEATQTAITTLQQTFSAKPDGRIDPGGRTWRVLNE